MELEIAGRKATLTRYEDGWVMETEDEIRYWGPVTTQEAVARVHELLLLEELLSRGERSTD